MKKILHLLFRSFFPILLTLLVGFVVYKNFSSETFITGWDNLHPEFNIEANLARSFSAVWQEYQGLGFLGGMGHAADLVRQLIIFVLLKFVPINLIRSGLIAFTLFIGPLGVYFLLRTLLSGKNRLTQEIPAFLGGVFYLLNLGTVLNFWVPFEPYYWFYGFLPWLIFFLAKYLQNRSKRNLLIFFVISLLATPLGYIQTAFVVYAILVFLLLVSHLIEDRFKGLLGKLKASGMSVFVIIAANAFWLAPVIFFTLTSSSVTVEAKMNKIATPEVVLSNRVYGNIKDIALLKGYWLSYYDHNTPEEKFDYLVAPWVTYLSNENVELVGLILFSVVLVGVLYAVFGKISFRWGLIATFLISFFVLLGENPPFGGIYSKINDTLPLISQIFRSPYTKWVVPMTFIYAVFFGLGSAFFIRIFSKVRVGFFAAFVYMLSLLSLLTFSVQPMFEGELIYPALKLKIPTEYFEVYEFFKGEPKERRIAFMPIQTFWGWNFYDWSQASNDWGYRGSGFLWYGLEQPILDRAFDVWSAENETFFHELNYALYSEDRELFEAVLNKYKVSYLLLDENVIEPGRNKEVLYIDKFKEFVESSENLHQTRQFGNIRIYETRFGNYENFLYSHPQYTVTDLEMKFTLKDNVYVNVGNYITDKEGVSFPFGNFNSVSGITYRYEGDKIIINSKPLEFSGKKNLVVPGFVPDENYTESPEVYVNDGRRLEVVLTPDNGRVLTDFVEYSSFDEAYNCDIFKNGSVLREVGPSGVLYKASGGAIACDFLNHGELKYNTAYLLRIKGENLAGRGLRYYLSNWYNQNIEHQELLPSGEFDQTFLLMPKNFETPDSTESVFTAGYTINPETRSFLGFPSENFVERIEFIPIPYDWLSGIRLVPEKTDDSESYISTENDLVIKNSTKRGTWFYKVQTEGEGLLVLGQGYEEGWKAFSMTNDKCQMLNGTLCNIFPWFGEEIEHVKVNSWANGFLVKNSQSQFQPVGTSGEADQLRPISTILIVFWPQYLQFAGFGLLILTAVGIIFWPKKGRL